MIVHGEGNEKAKVYIYGEAPGATEEKTGRPFCGGSGRILDSIMHSAGIDRGKCYVDNVVQRRPPKNDFGTLYKDKGRREPTEELLNNHRRVQHDILTNKPNVVVALGNEALYAITGRKGIMKWRGSILGSHGVKVIPSIHPAMVMRQYEYHPVSVLDFNRVKKEALTPDFPTPYNDNFLISPTFDQVMNGIQSLYSKKRVAFDIETAKNQIVCIGFAWSKEDSICIPIFFGDSSWWTLAEETAIVDAIRKLFLSPNIEFIAQNAQFDMIYLADKWNVEVKNLWMDTMVAFHCVYPELRKGLDFLSSIYTNRPYHKGMVSKGDKPDVLWTYNCLDTVVTWECAHEIHKELKEFGTLDFYNTNSHRLINPLISMQRRGVRIDTKRREEVDKELEKTLTQMRETLDNAIGHELNPNSNKQMKDWLYDEMNLTPQYNRKTGNLTADQEAIEALSKKYDNPIFGLILDIRKVRKVLTTYIRAPLDEDGRIRCSYVITGTETGRLSSRTSVYGSGTNLQNIPRDGMVRGLFIPDKGKKFINCDLSQAEARVVAYISGEMRLQHLFEEGGDIHTRNAAMIFNKTMTNVTKNERQIAKTLVHAANYGIGPRTFARHIGSNESRARELLNQYYALYPSIKLWHKDIENTIGKSRILRTPLGRAQMFFGRWGPDLIREAYAYIPQSTVSDILNLGIINAYPNMPIGWEMVMQVHDSVLMQVPIEADPIHIYKFMKHYFEIWIVVNPRTKFKIPIEIKEGSNWASLKKLEV